MNHSRTSGDSRRRGKRPRKFYSYCNNLARFVNSGLGRAEKAARTRDLEHLADEVDQGATAGGQKLSVIGPSTIECFGRERGGPIVRFELSGPDGERISFPIRCGLYAAGGEHE